MNKQQLEGQTVKQLMEIAGEKKIVGRHKMKKEQLIEAILADQTVEIDTIEEPEVKEETEVNLTKMEIAVLNATRTNEYNDIFDGPVYSFTVIENSGLPGRKVRGVLSSLVKKDLIFIDTDEGMEYICLTEKGQEVFKNADGEDAPNGGYKLLAQPEITPEVTTEKPAPEKQERTSGKGKVVQIILNGEVVEEFNKTYEASRWLSEKFNVKYSTVDRFLVGTIKGREMKMPKPLVGTEFENYEFRR